MLAPLPRQPLPFQEVPGVLLPGGYRAAPTLLCLMARGVSQDPGLLTLQTSSVPLRLRGLACPRPFTSPGGTSHPPAGPTLLLPSAQCPLSNGELKPESCLLGAGPGGAVGLPVPALLPLNFQVPSHLSSQSDCSGQGPFLQMVPSSPVPKGPAPWCFPVPEAPTSGLAFQTGRGVMLQEVI